MKKVTGILIVFCLVAAIVGAVVYYVITHTVPDNPKGTIGASAGNLNNGGFFHEQDGKVFFANAEDHYSLYVMDPDETHAKQLTDMYVDNICGSGKYIYFHLDSTKSRASGGGFGAVAKFYGIYRCRTSGTNQECILRELIGKMQLIDNDLYYQVLVGEDVGLNKMTTKGTDRKRVNKENIDPTCVSKGLIYYTGVEHDRCLHVIEPDRIGGDRIAVSGTVFYPVVDGNTVYYLDGDNDYKLAMQSLSGGSPVYLTYDRVDCFNITPNGIFYTTSQIGDQALKKIDSRGNITTIFNGVFNSINVTSRYLYFRSYDTGAMYHYPLDGSGTVTQFHPVVKGKTK